MCKLNCCCCMVLNNSNQHSCVYNEQWLLDQNKTLLDIDRSISATYCRPSSRHSVDLLRRTMCTAVVDNITIADKKYLHTWSNDHFFIQNNQVVDQQATQYRTTVRYTHCSVESWENSHHLTLPQLVSGIMHYNNLMSLSVCQLVGRGMQQVHIHRFPPALTAVVPLLVPNSSRT